MSGTLAPYGPSNDNYFAVINSAAADNSSISIGIYKRISGIQTTLAGPTTLPLGALATFRFQADGFNLTLYRNGQALLAATDTSLTGAGYAGFTLIGQFGGAGNNPTVDNWQAGDLPPSGIETKSRTAAECQW